MQWAIVVPNGHPAEFIDQTQQASIFGGHMMHLRDQPVIDVSTPAPSSPDRTTRVGSAFHPCPSPRCRLTADTRTDPIEASGGLAERIGRTVDRPRQQVAGALRHLRSTLDAPPDHRAPPVLQSIGPESGTDPGPVGHIVP